jgi:hypothetical protein
MAFHIAATAPEPMASAARRWLDAALAAADAAGLDADAGR